MNRFLFLIFAFIAFCSCSDDDEEQLNRHTANQLITASVEQITDEILFDSTRTLLVPGETKGYKVLWSGDEEISVFNKTFDHNCYKLADGAQTDMATFAPQTDRYNGEEFPFVSAYYPYKYENCIQKVDEGAKYFVDLLDIQTFHEDTIPAEQFPMIALSSGPNLSFQNVCGILKLRLKGNKRFYVLYLQGNNNEVLAGSGYCVMDKNGRIIKDWTVKEDGYKLTKLNLLCYGDDGKGTRLTDEATEFFFMVPPIYFSKGITVSIYGEDSDNTYKFSQPLKIERNKVLTLPVYEPFTQARLMGGSQFNTPLLDAQKITFQAQVCNLTDGTDVSYNKSGFVTGDSTDYYIQTTCHEFLFYKHSMHMFSLPNLKSITFDHCNTSEVINMSSMFENCKYLESLDVSSFNTSSVEYMYSMFGNCASLTSLDLSNFRTPYVRDMMEMFKGCTNLKSVDLSNFDTSFCNSMQGMFYGAEKLERLDLSHFKSPVLLDMSYMFLGCHSLAFVDLSNIDTQLVTDMRALFQYVGTDTKEGVEIILGKNFKFPQPNRRKTNIDYIFAGAKIKSIKCTKEVKQWILDNAMYNQWDKRDQSIETKWYDVEKEGNVPLN